MSRKILLLKTVEEEERTRPLYREIFPEDTEAFLDFYYRKRPKRILAMEEDGEMIAMLHLNPFLLSFFGREIRSTYIFAVGTKKEKRKQGIMGELLRYSFQLLKEEGEAFCFLIPVDERIYTPFGFRTVAKFVTEDKPVRLSDYQLFAVESAELLERRKQAEKYSAEGDLPENPLVMMKILNKELFLSYTGYPKGDETELLERLSKERLYFRDDI